jgi:Ca2+-binding EF-hand superfamily protein
MDANNDGMVSKEEYAARKSGWSGNKYGHHGKGKIFAKLDANNDGQLTRDESLGAWTNWFNRIDANSDQVVTADEVRDYRNRKMGSW